MLRFPPQTENIRGAGSPEHWPYLISPLEMACEARSVGIWVTADFHTEVNGTLPTPPPVHEGNARLLLIQPFKRDSAA